MSQKTIKTVNYFRKVVDSNKDIYAVALHPRESLKKFMVFVVF